VHQLHTAGSLHTHVARVPAGGQRAFDLMQLTAGKQRGITRGCLCEVFTAQWDLLYGRTRPRAISLPPHRFLFGFF
jgi:hypothetical protein